MQRYDLTVLAVLLPRTRIGAIGGARLTQGLRGRLRLCQEALVFLQVAIPRTQPMAHLFHQGRGEGQGRWLRNQRLLEGNQVEDRPVPEGLAIRFDRTPEWVAALRLKVMDLVPVLFLGFVRQFLLRHAFFNADKFDCLSWR